MMYFIYLGCAYWNGFFCVDLHRHCPCVLLLLLCCAQSSDTHMTDGNELSGTVPSELSQLDSLKDLNLGKLQQNKINTFMIKYRIKLS